MPLCSILPEKIPETKLESQNVRSALNLHAFGAVVTVPCLARFTSATLATHLFLLLTLLLIQDKHAGGALLKTMTFGYTGIPEACRSDRSKSRFRVA